MLTFRLGNAKADIGGPAVQSSMTSSVGMLPAWVVYPNICRESKDLKA